MKFFPLLFPSTRRPLLVSFCDRCARVCDAACRVESLQRQTLDRALMQRMRI